jgi:hypothetical protein
MGGVLWGLFSENLFRYRDDRQCLPLLTQGLSILAIHGNRDHPVFDISLPPYQLRTTLQPLPSLKDKRQIVGLNFHFLVDSINLLFPPENFSWFNLPFGKGKERKSDLVLFKIVLGEARINIFNFFDFRIREFPLVSIFTILLNMNSSSECVFQTFT